MERIGFRDVTGQRRTEVTAEDAGTVGDVLSRAVKAMGLPTQSQRGLAMDYQLRAANGSLLRPSAELGDSRVREALTAGECMAIPRLTAA